MIGDGYWSNGIGITSHVRVWTVSLNFWDDGFCQPDSTEGKLYGRYQIRDLDRMIDVLKADAERFGISWRQDVTVFAVGPADDPDAANDQALRRIANAQALRVGWVPCYRDPDLLLPLPLRVGFPLARAL